MQRLATAFLALAALISPLSAQAPAVRIMPLGDSITFGSSVPGGYRNKLYQLLTTAGYSVDFVGTQTGNGVASLPDPDHQGHGGWRIDELDANLVGWLSQIADPDVVLVHIGTNDFGQNFSTSTAINRLDGLITKIATLRPFAHIIVTNLMERGETANTKIQNEFNPFVQARVDAQAALGRRVTFLNMRAAVPLAEMPDNLHPGQAGYDHMADAWAPAIQAVIGVNGDDSPPQIVRMRGDVDRTHVKVTFSKPVADSAATPGNFSITGGLLVSAAQLDASKRVITLTTSQHAPGATYTVTVNGVSDRLTPTPLELPADSTGTFFTATPRGYANHVPESSSYTLALSMEVPNAANYKNGAVAYNVDNRNAIGPFSRVAYYLELQKPDGDLEYVWTSMDAFTSDVGKIGVPTLVSGAQFQQSVSGLTVVSNVPGVATGSGMTGNLEFWPTNYQGANSANVPGASPTFYDFGDNPTTGNYGSMQVHNTTDKKTVFAFNNWGGNTTPGDVDIGIGNDPAPVTNGVDWTFHHNAAQYTIKTLQVLVQTTGDTSAPTLASASATFGRTQVSVTFSEPLSPASVDAANFSLNGGVTVVGAVLSSNQREVVLTTSTQPLATPLTLTVSNVRDSSAGANKIAPNSTIAVTEAALPPEIVTNVGAAASGYHLVASINLPLTGNFNASNVAYLVDDRAAAGTFQRVAYYLELEKAGSPTQYVWVAMDPFTQNRNRIAIPTVASGAVYQMNINNMDVKSNVAGVVTGTGLTGGNIEFWPSDYAVANAVPVQNASATVFDAGDTRTTSGGNNFGSMQIHNHDVGANQTLLAINHFGADGNILDIGIGNNPTPVNGGTDWTYAANAPTYSRRILHVLVLPGATTLPADVLTRVPEAASYQHVYTLEIPAIGNLSSGTGFTPYTVDNKAEIGPFSRVAYYMELKKPTDTSPTFVWTSMDAFTNNVGRIGVPTQASGSFFQQKVTNLNVVSNSAGLTQGSGITTGNMEFWPSSYNATNAIGIPGADAVKYDWGDGNANGTSSGYGSMQVHNHGAGQVLFAINNWGAVGNTTNALCVGIGNNTASPNNLDWTFAANAGAYTTRLLHVFVLPGGNTDAVGPTLARVVPSTTLNRLVVVFNEALAEGSIGPANFVIPGLTVTSAKLLADQRSVALTTTPQTGGQAYTVNVSGVRDRSPQANLILSGASIAFTAYVTPPLLAGIPDAADYVLVNHLEIGTGAPAWNNNAVTYSIDEAKYGEWLFDRVAYCLQLTTGTEAPQWVYASFDAHTTQISKIGVPTKTVSATAMQQIVNHMNVDSNVAGIVKGTDLATGNIEFWGGDYSAPNAKGITGASATTLDFGDTMSTSGGHGSLQVHNFGATQSLLSYSNWGSATSGSTGLGIGNSTGAHPDWTFAANAATYSARNLYVLARPGGSPSGVAPVLWSHPASRSAYTGGSASFAVLVNSANPVVYQWRHNGAPIAGANLPWLQLEAVTPTDAGSYDVVVTTTAGGAFTISEAAALTHINQSPAFNGYTFTTQKDTAARVSHANLLNKGSDPDANVLTVTAVGPSSSQGGAVVNGTGEVIYTPANGFVGTDTFTITLSDGHGGTVAGTVNASVSPLAAAPPGQASLGLRADGKLDVLFQGIPGQSYHVQRSETLAPNSWSIIQTLPAGDDGMLPFTDPTPPADRAFYRIIPVP